MNFLQIGQRTVSLCGASNVTLTTMQNLAGEALRFYNWIADGWSELQTAHDDWEWLRSSALNGGGVSFVPASGVPQCAFGTNPGQLGIASSVFGGKWDKYSFRNYVTATGVSSEIFMDPEDYDVWRNSYMYGAQQSVKTRPVVVAVAPDKSLCVGPPSNGLYTVTGDYYTAPTAMSADADTPTGLPNQYHMLVVYKAMQFCGSYEGAPELIARGEEGYDGMFFELERQYGPRVRMAGAIA